MTSRNPPCKPAQFTSGKLFTGIHSVFNKLKPVLPLFAGVAFLSSCAAVEKLKSIETDDGYTLPAVENEDNAALVRVRSNDNPSDQQFLHLLIVDGETIMKLAESDRREFLLDPGTYTVAVTCHNVPNARVSSFPPNLRVADGRDELELTVEAGDETCLRVSKPILSCAGLEETASSVCN